MSENMNCPCCGATSKGAHSPSCALFLYLLDSGNLEINHLSASSPYLHDSGALRWAPQSVPAANLAEANASLARVLSTGKCGKCGDTDGSLRSLHGCPNPRTSGSQPSGGGKLTGDHYYRVKVAHPIAPDVQPYTAECADIIEALGMTFNEGEAFKAIWRLAAGRQGKTKNAPQYDADKAAHYGERIAACVRNNSTPTTN